MSKKIVVLLIMLLVLGSFTVCYAAEESPVDENVITLEQARKLAKENSRSLKKYDIDVDKAQYQLYKAEQDSSNASSDLNAKYRQYQALEDQYAALLPGDPGLAEISAKMSALEEQMSSQYDKVESSGDTVDDAEYDHDDSIEAEENYRKQLDYIVEELYTAILNQENSLQALNSEYELNKQLLGMETRKLGLGGSSQLKVSQMELDLVNLNKSILEMENQIKSRKGQLNDIMGREYGIELKLAPFEVKIAEDIPAQEQLYSSALQEYDAIKEIKREIDRNEDEVDDEDDYYTKQLLKIGIKEKELQLEDEKVNLNKTIADLIADTRTKLEEYKISLKDFENAKKYYEWDKKRFEMGIISKMALQESELNYVNLKNKKDSSGFSLYLAQSYLKLAGAGILN
ncbi:MAG: hypothetical protein JL50_02695 [Peptococcaceae bacterium BICA1-7]|nr:MAG: hypothetical protein JL50_02695 [Peptococcaceae bacterium BICA1-7]HBV97828.1 TolC family protein [Desulfotomaculum sp.]